MSALEIVDLSKSFGGVVVADKINITIQRGEIVGLIGPNGAGKTSLFNLISGLVKPDAGTIRLDGEPIEGLAMHARARLGVSRTWQHVRLFAGLEVLDNVMMGARVFEGENVLSVLSPASRDRRAAMRARALTMLARVGLAETASRYPGELSFGRQKLVALARALMNDGSCLLLDEPLAGVEGRVYDAIKAVIVEEAASGRAVCVVEHDISFVKDLCPRAVFMFNGRIVAEGTIPQLLARSELADLYFGDTD